MLLKGAIRKSSSGNGGLVSRTRHLANYFDEVTRGESEIRSIFRTEDEFHYLNEQFNKVILNARLAEERKLSQERRFRLLVERAPIGFFRTHLDGSIAYANAHFAQLAGRSSEELSRFPSVVLLYKNREDRKSFLAELQSNQEVRDRRIQYVRRSGEPMWLSVTAFVGYRSASIRDGPIPPDTCRYPFR
ncbi:MAG: PAS domain-containing protein [Alkalispirochaeta sp.]